MKARGNLFFVAGILAILVAVGAGYWLILGPSQPEPPPPAPEPVAPVDEIGKARLTRAAGVVEIRLGSGEWRAVDPGTQVGPDTDVRTGFEGSAALAYGDALDVELSSDSQVRLKELETDRARFEVQSGRLVADIRPDSGKVVQIGARDSDAVAETRDGRLHVLTDGAGAVQAAVTRGSAQVTAQGKTVNIPAGYQTSIRPGRAPQTPMVLPSSLLLKVKWPPKAHTKKKRQLVVGNTNPGARVRIGRTIVTADARGRFRAVIELREGKNELEVRALDVVGRAEIERSLPIELDTRGPSHAFETDPSMWKRKSP